jgi:molecular chaperone GrpE (heat shock protein)
VSRWLFNSSIAAYLENEIAAKAMDLKRLTAELELISSETERKHNVARQSELRNWLNAQLYDVIDKKFAKFLRLKHQSCDPRPGWRIDQVSRSNRKC